MCYLLWRLVDGAPPAPSSCNRRTPETPDDRRLAVSVQEVAGRHASELVLAPILGSQLVAVRTSWAACDLALMAAGLSGSRLPRLVVGHRAFDGEHAAAVVGDDQI